MNSNIISASTASSITSAVTTRTFSETVKKVALGAGVLGVAALGIFAIAKAVKKSNTKINELEAETARIHSETERMLEDNEVICEEIRHSTDAAIEAAKEGLADLKKIGESINADNAGTTENTTSENPEIASEDEETMLRECEDIEVYILDVLKAKGYTHDVSETEAMDKFLNDTIEVMKAVGYPESELDQSNPVYRLAVRKQCQITVDILPDMNGFNQKHDAINIELDAMQAELASDSDTADHIELTNDPEPKGKSVQPKHQTGAERRAARKAEKEPWSVVGSEANVAVVAYIRESILDSDMSIRETSLEETPKEVNDQGEFLSAEELIECAINNMSAILWKAIYEGELTDETIKNFMNEVANTCSWTIVKTAVVQNGVIGMIEHIPEWLLDTSNLISAIEDFDDSNINVIANAANRSDFNVAITLADNLSSNLADLIVIATRKATK